MNKRKALRKLNSKGFTLVEVIVVLVILALLIAVGVPTLLPYIDKAQEGVCSNNRAQVARQFSMYTLLESRVPTVEEFTAFCADNGILLKDVCPGNGTCSIRIANGKITVSCSKHAQGVIPLTDFVGDESKALQNAENLYMSFLTIWPEYFEKYPGFPGRADISVATGGGSNISYKYDGTNYSINISQEVIAQLNPNDVRLGDAKIYLKKDSQGKYTVIDYVVIKSGNTWAKYAAYGTETGTSAQHNASIPPPANNP